ncbi:MAG: phosphodiester glycosidase family protein [Myxococcales bacterium]|nr:phosphodiester glycosidase family protein [Myxococcales bacterium]
MTLRPSFALLLAAVISSLVPSCNRQDTQEQGSIDQPSGPEPAAPEAPSVVAAEPEGSGESPARQAPDLNAPLVVGDANALLSGEHIGLEEREWSVAGRSGVAWIVRIDGGTEMSVIPTLEVADFDQFIPAYDTESDWAVINGGFYDTDQTAMGLVLAHGDEHSPLTMNGGSGVFYLSEQGPGIVHQTQWRETVDQVAPTDAIQSIDRLVDEGRSLVNSEDRRGAARGAVALVGEEIWLVIAVDHDSVRPNDDGEVWLRGTSRMGMSLGHFADFLVALGADRALNLDGGGSSSLAVQIGGSRFRVRGERGTINALLARSPSP